MRKNKLIKSPGWAHALNPTADGNVDWSAAATWIQQDQGLLENKDMAEWLGIPASTFSEFRTGTGNLPWMAKLRLLVGLGCESLTEALDLLTLEESAEKLRRKQERLARKQRVAQ